MSTIQNIAIYNRFGMNWLLDVQSLVDRQTTYEGWELQQISILIRCANMLTPQNKKIIFFDIGTYFGLYSLLLYKTNIFDKIIAFDADVQNFNQLCANIFLNNATSIIAHNIAISDCERKFGPHSVDVDASNRGARCVKGIQNDYADDDFTIRGCALDSLYKFNDCVVIIKIDVEGHELHALRGMMNILKNNGVVLQVESFQENHSVVAEFLFDNGYSCFHSLPPDFYFTNIPVLKNISKAPSEQGIDDLSCARAAAHVFPESIGYNLRLAKILLKHKKHEEFEQILKQATSYPYSWGGAYAMLSSLYEKDNDYENAIVYAEMAVRLDPNRCMPKFVRLLCKKKEYFKAIQAIAESSLQSYEINLIVVHSLYWFILGRAADSKGLATYIPNVESGVPITDLINFFYTSKEYNELIADDEDIENSKKSTLHVVNMLISYIHAQRNNLLLAIGYAKIALELCPANSEYTAHLSQLEREYSILIGKKLINLNN